MPKFLKRLGLTWVPDKAITILPGRVHSATEEAAEIASLLDDNKMENIG